MRRTISFQALRARALCVLIALFAVALLPGISAAEEPNSTLIVGYPDKGNVSRVYADGRIEPNEVPTKGRLRGGSLAYGDDAPKPSPDGKFIAFVRDGELWLLDVRKRTTRQVTPARSAKDDSVGIYITAWSWDSRRLLYYDAPVLEPDASHAKIVGSMISADQARFRIYDLGNATTQKLTLPGRFAAWLPDGSFLLILDDSKAQQPPWRWRVGDAAPTVFVTEKASYGQFQVARDGRSVVAIAHFRHDSSEIVKIDTASGRLSRLAPPATYAAYNWPTLSPSGRQLAYLSKDSARSDGFRVGDLIVDGRAVARYAGWAKFAWIGDGAVAVIDGCALTVTSLRDARTLAQHKIPAKDQRSEANRERYCRALAAVK